jgi:hypothetical protein
MRLAAAIAFAGLLLGQQAAAQSTHYSVFCNNGRIAIESSTLEYMRNIYGRNVCMFAQFNYLSDAQNFVQRNYGGTGRSCSCG